jgi:hypothetical protein
MDSRTGQAEQRRADGFPRDSKAEYADVRHRIHALVGCLLDPGSTVMVVSKGDPGLVRLKSSEGWHFPRAADGKYAGHHPADGAEAVAHLEQLREEGADYFLLPSTYFWWLDQYDELAQHLRSRYRMVADCPDACLIYDLRAGPAATGTPVDVSLAGSNASNGAEARHPLLPVIRALLNSLLSADEPVLVASEGDDELLELGRTAFHFPGDGQEQYRSIGSLGQSGIAVQLTAARARGFRYLVLPETVRPGAEGSGVLREVLREHGREVATREGICAIYELDNPDD